DAGGGQILKNRRAEAASADDQHASPFEALLAGSANLWQHDMTRVALKFFRGKRLKGRHGVILHVFIPLRAYPLLPIVSTRPSTTFRNCIRSCSSANSVRSVPVANIWQFSSDRIENKAARRTASRCAAISSSSRTGVIPASLAVSCAWARTMP